MGACFLRQPSRRHVLGLALASVVAGGAWPLATLVRSLARNPSSPRSADPSGSHPLEIGPDPLSFGSLRPGISAKEEVTVRNRGMAPIDIERVETSCPCLEVAPLPLRIGPGQNGRLMMRFNPAEEPDFRGRLSVEVAGYGPNGRIAFRMRVRVEVRSDAPDPGR